MKVANDFFIPGLFSLYFSKRLLSVYAFLGGNPKTKIIRKLSKISKSKKIPKTGAKMILLGKLRYPPSQRL
jgi:hypothetical protein